MRNSVASSKTSMLALLTVKPFDEISSSLFEFQKTLSDSEVCEIANMNSKTQIVLSGTEEAVKRGAEYLKEKKMSRKAIPLRVSAPFHCRLMRPTTVMLQKELENITLEKPKFVVLFNKTAREETDPVVIKKLLAEQASSPVLWWPSLLSAQKVYEISDFTELGPSSVLTDITTKELPDVRARFAFLFSLSYLLS